MTYSEKSGTSGGGGHTSQTPGCIISSTGGMAIHNPLEKYCHRLPSQKKKKKWKLRLAWEPTCLNPHMSVHLWVSVAQMHARCAESGGRLKVARRQDKRALWQAALPCSPVTSCCHPPEITCVFSFFLRFTPWPVCACAHRSVWHFIISHMFGRRQRDKPPHREQMTVKTGQGVLARTRLRSDSTGERVCVCVCLPRHKSRQCVPTDI